MPQLMKWLALGLVAWLCITLIVSRTLLKQYLSPRVANHASQRDVLLLKTLDDVLGHSEGHLKNLPKDARPVTQKEGQAFRRGVSSKSNDNRPLRDFELVNGDISNNRQGGTGGIKEHNNVLKDINRNGHEFKQNIKGAPIDDLRFRNGSYRVHGIQGTGLGGQRDNKMLQEGSLRRERNFTGDRALDSEKSAPLVKIQAEGEKTENSTVSDPELIKYNLYLSNLADEPQYRLMKKPYIVNQLDFSLMVSPPAALCQGKVMLLIVILSTYQNIDRRRMIRTTWGARERLPESVRLAFIFGRSVDDPLDKEIAREGALYNDVIQYDFAESYQNLTLKSLSILRWATEHCPHAQFVLKADDDVLILPEKLLFILLSTIPRKVLMGMHNKIPVVLREGRWGVSREVFPYPYFPRYLAGPAYLMSGDVVNRLFETAKRVPLVPIEDAYITGILARIAIIPTRQEPGFDVTKRYVAAPNVTACEIVPSKSFALHFDSHALDATSLVHSMYKTIKELLSNCTTNIAIRRYWQIKKSEKT
ncbi:uncharacterized protein LOC106157012 [Lingula anatina]|uniref:Uncharacterized protein LOC106157012 n=1 Tax=Lingula anatina TaxID=7574 RepID=A0A1S3HPK7_LINAN|nr:uncharacterized protein LOC106157012 [Lingula anatina]|eukprot:XP_013387972.1 uncharacterized protein LOC106157012 [Lingula anatina]